MTVDLRINGKAQSVDDQFRDTPLLWVLRDHFGMTGSKYGCGIGSCGACSVLVDGKVQRSCIVPLFQMAGKEVTTIEGLEESGQLSPVQRAWEAHDVPQCGYCQSGMVMAATSLLAEHHDPSDEQIDAAMTNICRCGTYVRVRAAIKSVAK